MYLSSVIRNYNKYDCIENKLDIQGESLMNENEPKTKWWNKSPIVMLVIALIAGIWGGRIWTMQQYTVMKAAGFDQLQATYARIQNDYLRETESSELIDGAISGMVSSLDDQYSQFLPGEQGEQYSQSYEKEFYGIGAEIRQVNGNYFINAVYKDMPAEKSGLMTDDQIVKVNTESTEGMGFNELLQRVRGEKGTSVVLGIRRQGAAELVELEIERAEIPVYTVSSKMVEDGIGLIVISRFAQDTANEFKAALEQLQQEQTLKGLVIDLRQNPGGLLKPTVEIASVLVPDGELILDVVYKNENHKNHFVSVQEKPFDIPIAVVVNGHSASASEVLAAALKEAANAYIVGDTTYGKGVVQSIHEFKSGSVLVLTEAQWRTPSGAWINEVGVEPTHEVALPSYAYLRAISAGAELKRNSYGEDVGILQQMLIALGFNAGDNELFDEQTEQALRQYEKSKGLAPAGKYNDEIGNLLIQDLRELLANNDVQLQKAISLLQ